ncbi:MAG: hypothetical protein KKE79_05885 [Actinobacteria bacterium]|nr:hypothetical protein [Actinomycetota bacterium]
MSEYQYYEFHAVDRPLTQKQMAELRSFSSRARITPSSFVNVYNWGSFKGDRKKWMEKHFDAFLYLANWGSRWLEFRIPARLLEADIASPYCAEDNLSCRTKGDHLILSFHSEEEDYEWAEGEGWLASLVPLRADLMHGDHRCLYLGWLLGAQGGELDDEALEPPVPPGLGDLSAPLRSFADFLRIDYDLIAAAAEQSDEGPASGLSKKDITKWVARLPAKDKDTVLTRLLEVDDPHIVAELRQRALREIHGARESGGGARSSGRRSVVELLARVEEIALERRKKEAEQRVREKARSERERAAKWKKHLESLVGKEGGLWAEVDQLIATRQPKRYDEAVSLLQDLHDLADMQGRNSEFLLRMNALYSEHTKKTTLVERFRKAKLAG